MVLETMQQNTPKRNHLRRCIRAIATFAIPFYTLIASTSSYGNVPAYGKIEQILGQNDIGIRRNRQPAPAPLGTILRRFPNAIYMPATGKTFAQLDFYNSVDQHMELAVQTSTKNELITLYHFPCNMRLGDSSIIEWLNEKDGKRGCEKGIRISPGDLLPLGPKILDKSNLYPALKQLLMAQTSRRRFFQSYCTVLADNGRGWIGVKASGDPCQEPLQKCQTSAGSGCAAVTLDRWTVRFSDLTALVACANNQVFTKKGTGARMKDLVYELWQQAEAQGGNSCALHVLGPKDIIVLPSPSGERILSQIRNTDSCLALDVISGAAAARSAKRPKGVALKPGDRYIYCGEQAQDRIERFDRTIESIELQVFLAKERGYKFCDRQQASGGSEVKTQTIQLTATEGVIRIYYEMYDVPDRLQVWYENSLILDTQEVSDSDTLSVPFKGTSSQVTVKLIGNQDTETKWNYTVHCPQ